MDNLLVGKFIKITLRDKRTGRYQAKNIKRICKVLSFNSNNDTYSFVSVKTGELYMKKIQMVHHEEFNNQGVFIRPLIITDNGSYIKTKDGKWWIEDFYLHRIGGPAMDTEVEKKYYLYGSAMEKEEYLDAMTEDIQTEMLFHLDKI